MEIIEVGGASGHAIHRFGSSGARHHPLGLTEGDSAVGLIALDAEGVVGRHPAVADQLFIVVEGEGWVSGEDEVRVDIKAGQAALWRAGESHQSSTSSGMTAVAVEANVVRQS